MHYHHCTRNALVLLLSLSLSCLPSSALPGSSSSVNTASQAPLPQMSINSHPINTDDISPSDSLQDDLQDNNNQNAPLSSARQEPEDCDQLEFDLDIQSDSDDPYVPASSPSVEPFTMPVVPHSQLFSNLRADGDHFYTALVSSLVEPRNAPFAFAIADWDYTPADDISLVEHHNGALCSPNGLFATIDRLENQNLLSRSSTLCAGRWYGIFIKSTNVVRGLDNVERHFYYEFYFSWNARAIVFESKVDVLLDADYRIQEARNSWDQIIALMWTSFCQTHGGDPSILKYIIMPISDHFGLAREILAHERNGVYELGNESQDSFFALLGIFEVLGVVQLLEFYPQLFVGRHNPHDPRAITTVKTVKNIRMREDNGVFFLVLTLEDSPFSGSNVIVNPTPSVSPPPGFSR